MQPFRRHGTRPVVAGVTVTVTVTVMSALYAVVATSPPASADAGSDWRGRPVADLRTDTDRDGRVDVSPGADDDRGEDLATASRGALVLANLDDDARRCRVTDGRGRALPDAALARCSDAADDVVDGARDLADLAPLRTVPIPDLPDGGTGRVTLVGPGAGKARVFLHRGGSWQPVGASTRLTAADLRAGAELALEMRDVVRDTRWDGTVDVRLDVTPAPAPATTRTTTATTTPPTAPSSDTVRLRVAPILLQDNTMRVTTVFAGSPYGTRQDPDWWRPADPTAGGSSSDGFLADLHAGLGTAALPPRGRALDGTYVQDLFEPAYASVPGPDGRLHVMRYALRSPVVEASGSGAAALSAAGRQVFSRLRGPDVAALQIAAPIPARPRVPYLFGQSLNAGGNLEALPPLTAGDRTYPDGRILMGRSTRRSPDSVLVAFLSAQAQPPVFVDTSWLAVGHVDEILQVVPAPRSRRGWKIAVADPATAYSALRRARAVGLGARPLLPAVDGLPADPYRLTVSGALASRDLAAANRYAGRRIDAALAALRREAGITDADVVRLPVLFTRIREAEVPGLSGPQLTALTPNVVNGLPIDGRTWLGPRQHTPALAGRDLFQTVTQHRLSRLGLNVAWVDTWDALHFGLGELHCGTNAFRDVTPRRREGDDIH